MKKILMSVSMMGLSLVPMSAKAEAFLGTFALSCKGGARLGKDEKEGRISKPYLGLNVSHSEFKFAGKNRVSIFSTGVNYDSDLVFSVSISPISIIVPDTLTVGIDYFIHNSHKSESGNLGLFIGFPFGN